MKNNNEFYAHSENEKGELHFLSSHLNKVAQLMESFVSNPLYKNIFGLTGLIHDLGKYQVEFQKYLIQGSQRGSVPHASWGAALARELGQIESSFAIDGHHKGLPDKSSLKADTNEIVSEKTASYRTVIQEFLSNCSLSLENLRNDNIDFGKSALLRECFIRFLFSSLTDADWLDTEAHFNSETASIRSGFSLEIKEMFDKLGKAIAEKSKEGDINRLRNNVRLEAIQNASKPCGFYALNLPTGMGKTLTSIAWALKHAELNNLKRIFVVLPYINIIDQTAAVLKNIFGETMVLEHHSGYNEDNSNYNSDECESTTLEKRKKLACENWDYPLIITTTVQFFHSLFGSHPAKSRKIHNISDSVVIFDEVQTFTMEVILPTIEMLKNIQLLAHTSFLFCTATQPAFGKRTGFDGIEKIEYIVGNPAALFDITRRVDYHLFNKLEPVDIDILKSVIDKSESSILIIFNTKKKVLEFFNCYDSKDYVYHLSTSMCPIHRKKTIMEIRERLANEERIIVCSTQLIEAGVDFDFPTVFREIAPLESIIQAAGRCNREGKLKRGDVLIFQPEDRTMPDKTYEACTGFTKQLLIDNPEKLHEHTFYESYYASVIKLFTDPDNHRINEARKNFHFSTVNDSYRLIKDATVPLFIYRYNEESRNLFNSISAKQFPNRDDYRKMQQFTVQVFPASKYYRENRDLIETTVQGISLWHGGYDSKTGISTELPDLDILIL